MTGKDFQFKFRIKAEDRASKVIDGAKNKLMNFKSQLIGFAVAAVSISTVVVALGTLKDTVLQVAKAGSELEKLSVRLGVGAEVLSQYQHVARATGVEFENLIDSMQNMRVRAAEAAAGEKEMLEPFEKLGVKIKEFKKLNIVEQFEALAIAFSRVADSGERLMLADQIFEGEGLALLQTLSKGIKEIERIRREGNDLGGGITAEQVKQLAKLNSEVNKMKITWENYKTAFVLHILPILNDGMRKLGLTATNVIFKIKRDLWTIEAAWIRVRLAFKEFQVASMKPMDWFHKKSTPHMLKELKVIDDLKDRLKEIAHESQSYAANLTFDKDGEFISNIEKLMNALTKAGVKAKNTVYEFKAVFKVASDEAAAAAEEMFGHFAEFLFDPLETSIGDLAKNFLDTLRRMLTNQLAQQLWFMLFPVRPGTASNSIDMGLDKLLSFVSLGRTGSPAGVGKPITINITNTTNVTGGGKLDSETKAYIDQSNQRMGKETFSAIQRVMNAGQLSPRKGFGYA